MPWGWKFTPLVPHRGERGVSEQSQGVRYIPSQRNHIHSFSIYQIYWQYIDWRAIKRWVSRIVKRTKCTGVIDYSIVFSIYCSDLWFFLFPIPKFHYSFTQFSSFVFLRLQVPVRLAHFPSLPMAATRNSNCNGKVMLISSGKKIFHDTSTLPATCSSCYY